MQTAESPIGIAASAYRPAARKGNSNGLASRHRIVERCRALMVEGIFRPTQRDMVVGIITLKTMKYHFASLADLYEAALDDEATMEAIARHVLPGVGAAILPRDRTRLALAVVFGRLRT